MSLRLTKVAFRWVMPSSTALLLLSLTVSLANGQIFKKWGSPCPTPETCPSPEQKPAPEQPVVPQPPDQAVAPEVSPEQFGAAGGGESFASVAPNIIGDGGVGFTGYSSAIAGEIATRASSFKIGENESPRPGASDRIYLDYNYFNNVGNLGTDAHRIMPGFEKTFLDGNASFGMRLPTFVTFNDPGVLHINGIGNLQMIGKYAWFYDRETGNVFSSGLSLTVPSGIPLKLTDGTTIRDVIIQPFVGGIYNRGDFYGQGFLAIAIPTDERDVTFAFNDVAMGYRVYRGSAEELISAVTPSLELHLNIPLLVGQAGRDPTTLLPAINTNVVVTSGVHIEIYRRAMLTVGLATPISATGITPFNYEGILQFNYRF